MGDPESGGDARLGPITLPLGGVTASVEVSGVGPTTTTYAIEIARGRDVLEYVHLRVAGIVSGH